MIRAYFTDIDVTSGSAPVAAVPPGPKRVAIRFAGLTVGAYLASSAFGGRLVLRADGQNIELTRQNYCHLLEIARSVTPAAIGGVFPAVTAILISQEVSPTVDERAGDAEDTTLSSRTQRSAGQRVGRTCGAKGEATLPTRVNQVRVTDGGWQC